MTGVLAKGENWTQAYTQGESDKNTKAKLRAMYLQAPEGQRLPSNHQKQGEGHEVDSPSQPSEARNPAAA